MLVDAVGSLEGGVTSNLAVCFSSSIETLSFNIGSG